MELEYDRKFEEMKRYIPFLESMIKRLESTSSPSNPRQAQLNKIRSLRDLLLDKKKRMKMENLLKCEQVLVNLYAKVEQKDSLPGIQKPLERLFVSSSVPTNENADLNTVRNKLKSVASKLTGSVPETLPEIARRTETEVVCSPGSKEPALFQRRPHRISKSPNTVHEKSPHKSFSKRNYTRVLVSPESSSARWQKKIDSNRIEDHLFSRRSPRRSSPRRFSPTYYRREKKKSSKQSSHSLKSKDLNITLKVPEESLSSLNTKDIVSRIINCNDKDVDIDTLRELRSQILGELKQTGASDDISDLILRSYKCTKKAPKTVEVEEGELSDSESEAIENIYGNLKLIVEKDQNTPIQDKAADEKSKEPRKIQICLVVNHEKEVETNKGPVKEKIKSVKQNSDFDNSEFEMYKDNESDKTKPITKDNTPTKDSFDNIETEEKDKNTNVISEDNDKNKVVSSDNVESKSDTVIDTDIGKIEGTEPFKANFYKPIQDHKEDNSDSHNTNNNKTVDAPVERNFPREVKPISHEKPLENRKALTVTSDTVKIPLLNEPNIVPEPKKEVSEIDILQALKNEILSESIAAIPGSEVNTPPLHQPKVTKVASAQEILSKKRISIEKYKEKAVSSTKVPLFVNEPNIAKDDNAKKQSLKLTEKECERFNFLKLTVNDSSDEDDMDLSNVSLGSTYDNLAPKSPDHEDRSNIVATPPVIIPQDPIKTPAVISKNDVDMRNLLPVVSTAITTPLMSANIISKSYGKEIPPESKSKIDAKSDQTQVHATDKSRPADPRIKRDLSQPMKESPKHHSNNLLNPDRTSQNLTPVINYSGLTPSMTPSMTPNARTYEMTPSHQSFEIDERSNRTHVYAPAFPIYDAHEYREKSVTKDRQRNRYDSSETRDNNNRSNTDSRNSSIKRYQVDKRDFSYRSEFSTPSHPFGRMDCPTTPNHPFGRSDCPPTPSHPFGRLDCPTTPSHPFGRSDCPPTPSHPFGRSECPTTPSHPFGRSDCPSTQSHPFGRMDCPSTPSHPFGRSECPSTPSHPFGRTDCPPTPFGRSEMPMTPIVSFGRSDSSSNHSPYPVSTYVKTQDPRLNRGSDYDSGFQKSETDRDRHFKDVGTSKFESYTPDTLNRSFNNSDSFRNYGREQSVGRNERNRYETSSRRFEKDNREQNLGRMKNKYEDDVYSRDRHRYGSESQSFKEVGSRRNYRNGQDARLSVRPDEENSQSSNRSSSVGVHYNKNDKASDNTVSVQAHTGRSFTIDTSINRSFQEMIGNKGIQVFDYTFDARKQRAASVGRSMGREVSLEKSYNFDIRKQRASSVGRSLMRESSVGRICAKQELLQYGTADNKGRNDFRRARSMGRDIGDLKTEKDIKDIKVDFESYKSHSSKFFKNNPKEDHLKLNLKQNDVHKRSRRDKYEVQSERKVNANNKLKYSPRNNYRDPRMRREQKQSNKSDRESSRDQKTFGIVYSNDNIAKGTILGSGYGVKNYKIPKIKRAVEESELQEVKVDSSKDKKIDDTDNVKKEKKKVKEFNAETGKNRDIEDNVTDKNKKRITRSSKKSDAIKMTEVVSKIETTKESNSKIRRSKIGVIYDTDSESESSEKPEIIDKKESSPSHSLLDLKDSLSNDNSSELNTVKNIEIENQKKQDNELLDSSFCIDDIDLFSDNVVSDNVIDNINALIANLDHDLDASKNTNDDKQLTKEIENILENICNSKNVDELLVKDSLKKPIKFEESKLQDEISKSTTADTNLENEIDKKTEAADKQMLFECQSVDASMTKITDNLQNVEQNQTSQNHKNITVSLDKLTTLELKCNNVETPTTPSNICSDLNKIYNENIVSTTENDNEQLNPTNHNYKKQNADKNIESCSTPDSTIGTNDMTQNEPTSDELPDSTHNLQSEMNSDITSTHDSAHVPSKDIEAIQKETVPPIDSIGSLLSILQDKTKIKELLTMLGDSSNENEKIKKKLEKLSEIVSDDEDTNDIEGKDKKSEECVEKENNESVVVAPDNIEDTGKIRKSVEKETPEKSIDKAQDESEIDNAVKDTNKESTKSLSGDESNQDDEINQKKVSTQQPNNEESIKLPQNDELEEKPENPADGTVLEKSSLRSTKLTKKLTNRKNKFPKKNKGKFAKNTNTTPDTEKRVTRSEAHTKIDKRLGRKKTSELQKLQNDIKEMFLSEDILNATGIRMCRLAKLVTDKSNTTSKEEKVSDAEAIVLLEKYKQNEMLDDTPILEKATKKKPGPKGQRKDYFTQQPHHTLTKSKIIPKYKPGPKSKKKNVANDNDETDPYVFETDSISETNTSKTTENTNQNTSDSESDSVSSSKSFASTDLQLDLKKKKKRRRAGWKAGVIKSKNKKKKADVKQIDTLDDHTLLPQRSFTIPDLNCFTDKSYCFLKNVSTYNCRLCTYNGDDIVHHYKKNHPHTEIPLSRMSPVTAKEAIEQCEEINFQALSKIPTDKYVCRFCFKEFSKKKNSLEAFFWHVVSKHTGEYKQTCSECITIQRCPFNLDIPPPPKDVKGQLIGFICGKCNFTQISLENLKTHVIIRHNDEQTEVYTINLAVMNKKTLTTLSKVSKVQESYDSTSITQQRTLRSSRSNQSMTEASDERSEITESSEDMTIPDLIPQLPSKDIKEQTSTNKTNKKSNIQFKLSFENDDNVSEASNLDSTRIEDSIKIEQDDESENLGDAQDTVEPVIDPNVSVIIREKQNEVEKTTRREDSDDILPYPHFKIKFKQNGAKEYVCCINGIDNHYSTALLISMKKHVQITHKETWDGYCFICKVIVTPQGVHKFKDCFQHFIDIHMDNFPILENHETNEITGNLPNNLGTSNDCTTLDKEKQLASSTKELTSNTDTIESSAIDKTVQIKPYVNVRPLSELMSDKDTEENTEVLPVIDSVISLLPIKEVEQPLSSPIFTFQMPITTKETSPIEQQYKYEEAQSEIMSKKHRVVLDAMLSSDKLVRIFKCAGRYCSFTSDSADEALLHASTHQRIGGENSLNCTYCDYNSMGNAIDLVMHVFMSHGNCGFVCRHCFYRAAASQLVGAHIRRCHGDIPSTFTNGSVLRTTVVTPVKETVGLLSREAAVPYFTCNHVVNDTRCKFRTYTAGKYTEHLLVQHKDATTHSCYFCQNESPTAAELIGHLKLHGLKLYQCAWCGFGADNETELLAHASAKHPSKQPHAYLRIITTKDGSSEFRVLPLAHLVKTKVLTEDITPSISNENPVREAERSIELEKLIGHTTQMIESMNAIAGEPIETHNITPEMNITENVLTIHTKQPPNETKANENVSNNEIQTAPSIICNPTTSTQDENISQNTPIVPKTESVETTPEESVQVQSNSDVIYCLDSDEEEAGQNASDLSEKEVQLPIATSTQKPLQKFSLQQLYKCGNCGLIAKNLAGFKRHIFACIPVRAMATCGHCAFKTIDRKIYFDHYNQHTRISSYSCGICNERSNALTLIKKHLKVSHGVTKILVSSTCNEEQSTYVISEATNLEPKQQTKPPKRKLSSGNASEKELQNKRYGPQDIHLLPINPILDEPVYCVLCEFNTKVRLNMLRHLQLHTQQQPVPQTAPVNPVPHLETNEKHFDKMVNLASSSIVNRAPDKSTKADNDPVCKVMISPNIASRYPKYVPERQRHTCGAKDCSYISVDEAMLRCHWETLHNGTNDYHCVHCPPYQHLDTSKPLTASRILAHLKMHDVRLYACSLCSYYHYKRHVVEKHLSETHKSGQVLIVREEVTPPAATTTPQVAAPTMDLKPWQCGLCEFKSMLRPEVVDHCAKLHQSKMQFKCSHCPFRTSTIENVTKHQSKSHPDKSDEVFYFYYREGSIPDEAGGMKRWQKQCQKHQVSIPDVKTDPDASTVQVSALLQPPKPSIPSDTVVDLNLVKQEVDELDVEESTEALCKRFGQFGDPNGLKFKCPLCNVVNEDCKEKMRSHLYEELKYRKWNCNMCSYKAFHKAGLNEHMSIEHRISSKLELMEPPKLDAKLETWVNKLLEHQSALIDKHRENLVRTNKTMERPGPPSSKIQAKVPEMPVAGKEKYNLKDLEQAFGEFGEPKNVFYSCPKCEFQEKDRTIMQEHLENELSKIRWRCSKCSNSFQTYHEAQFHCKSMHLVNGQPSRPIEAFRDPAMRSAWVAAVITTQTHKINKSLEVTVSPQTKENELDDQPENSLLVVRYEERVPTPEEQMALKRKRPIATDDSDDENLVIDEDDEQQKKKQAGVKKCPHCHFTSKYAHVVYTHTLRHYNMKPLTCIYCGLTLMKRSIDSHYGNYHYGKPVKFVKTEIPRGPPLNTSFVSTQTRRNVVDDNSKPKVICLICEKSIPETECPVHVHENQDVEFASKGDVVVKCCICLSLHLDISSLQKHQSIHHSNVPVNYAFFKLHHDTREIHNCGHCSRRFKFLRDLKSHHEAVHKSLILKYTTHPHVPGTLLNDVIDLDGMPESSNKRKLEDENYPLRKRVARKSTTKLPGKRLVARKSTTKLPYDYISDSESNDEFSFYGTNPTPIEDLQNVTTLMPFYNTVMPFTLQKLDKIIKINPKVVVKDINK